MTRFVRTMPGPANELVYATVGRIPLRTAHEVLTAEQAETERRGYDMDDMGEHAMAHWASLRAGLADRRLAELAEQEAHDRTVRESVRHFAQCRGSSCNQGRLPCRERCNVEMACTTGNDPPPWWTPNGVVALVIIAVVGAGVLLCWVLAF